MFELLKRLWKRLKEYRAIIIIFPGGRDEEKDKNQPKDQDNSALILALRIILLLVMLLTALLTPGLIRILADWIK